MAKIHRIRVVAVGSEQDMLRMCRVMLSNNNNLDEDELGPVETLESRLREVREHAAWEAGPGAEFLAGMLTPEPYGELIPEKSRFQVQKQPCGLYTALFTCESTDVFQAEDWQRFHKDIGKTPLFAVHANEDFARDKGECILTNGEVYEDWEHMAECWLWVQKFYYNGHTPEEICGHLKQMLPVFREEWDEDIATLLQSCIDNLESVRAKGEAVTAEAIEAARAAKDYETLFELQRALADTLLWDTERICRWNACLQTTLDEWKAEEDD